MAFGGFQKKMQTNNLLSYYLTTNINNICRICLEKSHKLTPIFDPIKPPHFSVLIMACASVQVQEGDGLPPLICQRCISRLNLAFQFKTQCESSDAKLRQCFENYNLTKASTIKKHHSEIIEAQNTNNKAVQNKQTQLDTIEEIQFVGETNCEQLFIQEQSNDQKYNKDINTESIDKAEPLLEHQQENESKNKSTEDFKIEVAEEISTVKLSDFEIGKIENTASGVKRKKPPKVHQCNTCGKIFKTKPSLVHHIRIHTGERPYVCHLCQKRFVNGGHLHTHMKSHTGEKNHICAACNKGFATSQQLTKHTIAIHTSERPYGCTYCAKRFASSSNLNTHIKIHTGEKNFHCEICGKTFSTKGQLQQHMLVHTGEKAFLCEYCNKRFSQKAHLLRHLRTHNRTE